MPGQLRTVPGPSKASQINCAALANVGGVPTQYARAQSAAGGRGSSAEPDGNHHQFETVITEMTLILFHDLVKIVHNP